MDKTQNYPFRVGTLNCTAINDRTESVARWPEFLTFFGPITLPLIRERVRVVETGAKFLPGLRPLGAPGHRPGHSAVEITSAGEQLLHLADVVGHPILMERPAWPWYADHRTGQAEKDQAQFLNQSAKQLLLVLGSHLPFPGVGRVGRLAEGWRWQPVEVQHGADSADSSQAFLFIRVKSQSRRRKSWR